MTLPILPIWNPECNPEEQEQYVSQPDDALVVQVFENRVKKTIDDHQLISKNAQVLVAVSGGKDSLATLFVLKKLGYAVEAVTIDVHIGCYTKKNLENVRKFCANHEIKLHVFEFRKEYGYSVCYMQSVLKNAGHEFTSCTVCGVLRRRLLNKLARERKATVIATGHNMDDEVQAVLMNWATNKAGLNARLGPLAKNRDEGLVPRIKPLYFTPEEDVIRYTKILNFPVHYGRCPCSVEGLRFAMRNFVAELEKINPDCKKNLLQYFLNNKPQTPVLPVQSQLNSCTHCGEPASSSVCRSCQILGLLNEVTKDTNTSSNNDLNSTRKDSDNSDITSDIINYTK
ncbi:MAG: TIGR00269 family protein [Candidatus Woesearchaeota archaeon]|nr:TIGR00269 family protein [Candidatus Woesearchaeota archaeon]